MEKRALFFDYDGTIIAGGTGKIPAEIPDLFDQLKARGHLLFLNTGRTRCFSTPIAVPCPLTGTSWAAAAPWS